MDIVGSTLDALFRDYTLWIIILSVLYAFSLYVYFFPTPLSGEGFVATIPQKYQPVQ
jgi:hypothetical protein